MIYNNGLMLLATRLALLYVHVHLYRYISVTIMKGCGRFVGGYSFYLGVVCHMVGCSFYLGLGLVLYPIVYWLYIMCNLLHIRCALFGKQHFVL